MITENATPGMKSQRDEERNRALSKDEFPDDETLKGNSVEARSRADSRSMLRKISKEEVTKSYSSKNVMQWKEKPANTHSFEF